MGLAPALVLTTETHCLTCLETLAKPPAAQGSKLRSLSVEKSKPRVHTLEKTIPIQPARSFFRLRS